MNDQRIPEAGDIVIINDVIGNLVCEDDSTYIINTVNGKRAINKSSKCVCFAKASEIAALYAKHLLEVITR